MNSEGKGLRNSSGMGRSRWIVAKLQGHHHVWRARGTSITMTPVLGSQIQRESRLVFRPACSADPPLQCRWRVDREVGKEVEREREDFTTSSVSQTSTVLLIIPCKLKFTLLRLFATGIGTSWWWLLQTYHILYR